MRKAALSLLIEFINVKSTLFKPDLVIALGIIMHTLENIDFFFLD